MGLNSQKSVDRIVKLSLKWDVFFLSKPRREIDIASLEGKCGGGESYKDIQEYNNFLIPLQQNAKLHAKKKGRNNF